MAVTYIIYFTKDGEPKSHTSDDLNEMLKITESLRKLRREGANITHITTASEDTNMVGEQGVDTIADGKTPDGIDYTWKKRRQ